MSVPWHKVLDFLRRALDHDAKERLDGVDDVFCLPHEPQAHVRCDLVISGASRVQLSADRADELCEPPLVRGMDVLIAGLDLELETLLVYIHIRR